MTLTFNNPRRWNTDDLQGACRSLRNLLGGNATPATAFADMAEFQAHRAAVWLEASRTATTGKPVSACLRQIGWPDHLTQTIALGDDTGNYPAIFEEITREHAIDRELSSIYGKLKMPAVFFVLAIAIGIFTMGYNVFMLNKQLPAEKIQDSLINKIAIFCNWPISHPAISGGVLAALSAIVVFALSQKSVRDQLHDRLIRLPNIGPSLRYLIFALWARRVSLLTNAGIALPDAMVRAARTFPISLKRAIEMIIKNNTRGLAVAATPTNAADPRHLIPIYVRNAIKLSDKFGNPGAHFSDAADSLVYEGRGSITKTLERLELLGMVTVYTAAGVPIALSIFNMSTVLKAA